MFGDENMCENNLLNTGFVSINLLAEYFLYPTLCGITLFYFKIILTNNKQDETFYEISNSGCMKLD